MKNYLIIGLIALAMLMAQGVSADTGAGGNVGCAAPNISSVVIVSPNDAFADPGFQIQPTLSDGRAGVLPCTMTPNPACCALGNCACIFNASGSPVALPNLGTHCLCSAGTFIPCNMTPPKTGCNDTCEYDAKGKWIGPGLGGYTYNPDDGYKIGLKRVTVQATVTAPNGIRSQICQGGGVYLTVDNYDLQKQKVITLAPVNMSVCNDDTVTTAVFNGSFDMHYWEKPGWYTIEIEAVECCGKKVVDTSAVFEYTELSAMFVLPEKTIDYGEMIPGQVAIADGDVNTSTCEQCDIGSEPATIRNLGNTMINVGVSSDDMICDTTQTPGCVGNLIPVSSIFINFGISWNQLSKVTTPMNLYGQAYCKRSVWHDCNDPNPALACKWTNETAFGLPPGPHATNILSLEINPVPNIKEGYYSHTIHINYVKVPTDLCCQDHREIQWPANSACITPPQCYETGRYGVAIGAVPGVTCNKPA